jgi:hypothetical protein
LAADLWSQSEGAVPAWHNVWYATYLSGLGDHRCTEPATLPDGSRNGPHVSFCPDYAAMNAAYAEFWNSNYWDPVIVAMQGPNIKGKLERIYLAINGLASGWANQKGLYPIKLYDYLHGHGSQLISPVLAPGHYVKPVAVEVNIFNAWHDLTRQFSITVPREIRRLENSRLLIKRLGETLPATKRKTKGG